jgi:arylsulfatase A-like enzyme
MDTVVRTDRELERLLDFLDREVGSEHVLVVLTADHGAAPLPEVARLSGHPEAGRVSERELIEAVGSALTEAYGVPLSGPWIAFHDFPNLFLDEQTLRAESVPVQDAERIARDTILALPGIKAAYTRSRLQALQDVETVSPPVRMALLSFRADRSGHVVYQVLPYNVVADTGTNHGSHWDYDRHVPLMWLGTGVQPGRHAESVSPADIAPTLRVLLGLEADPEAPGRVLWQVVPPRVANGGPQ